jgi:hypothetical protein
MHANSVILLLWGSGLPEARKGARTEEAGEHVGDIKAVALNLHHEAAGDGQLQKLGKGRRRDRIRKHRLERGRHIGNILRRGTHSAACTENYTRSAQWQAQRRQKDQQLPVRAPGIINPMPGHSQVHVSSTLLLRASDACRNLLLSQCSLHAGGGERDDEV